MSTLLLLLHACRADKPPCAGADCDSGRDLDSGDQCVSVAEIAYDGIDQDCDGLDLTDVDEDGWDEGEDCDDEDSAVNPDAEEVPYDGVDQDCDELDLSDVDGDGWEYDEDCEDGDPGAYPGATEVFGNGVDDDCDGVADEIYVCSEGGDFVTIQEGVDAAPDGGLVEVCPGTYYESVILPDQSLSLVGLGSEPMDVVVEAGGADSALYASLSGRPTFVVSNIALTGSVRYAVEILCEPDKGSASANSIEVFGLTSGAAIRLGCERASLSSTRVRDGISPYVDDLPYVDLSAGSTTVTQLAMTNIEFYSNSQPLLEVGSIAEITNSVFAGNTSSAGIVKLGAGPDAVTFDAQFSNNTVVGNRVLYEDDGAIVYSVWYWADLVPRLRYWNNVFADNTADWVWYFEWDWCNDDIPVSELSDALAYNLIHGTGAAVNPPNNLESDCAYYEYVSGCTCRDYGSDAVDDLFWANETNSADSPIFKDEFFHLETGSPGVDAGDPSDDQTDFDGTRNDMGAYGGPLGNWEWR